MNRVISRHDRHNPFKKHGYLSIQHLERYRFACSLLCPGSKVLDIACGTGYGTSMLVKHGCNVIGADIDEGVLEKARREWSYNGFRKADVLKLPFSDESFDAVVSFETIEHVRDGERFLSEMYRVLRPGGIFICSTPNIEYSSHPSFHLKEYEVNEFFELIESYFVDVKRFGQYFTLMDRLKDIIRWNIRTNLVKSIEAANLKKIIKKLLLRSPGLKSRIISDDPLGKEQLISEKIMTDSPNPSYMVKPFNKVFLLRIMLAVGRKRSTG